MYIWFVTVTQVHIVRLGKKYCQLKSLYDCITPKYKRIADSSPSTLDTRLLFFRGEFSQEKGENAAASFILQNKYTK